MEEGRGRASPQSLPGAGGPPSRWASTRATRLGAKKSFFFPPPAPLPHPHPWSGWGGFGSIGEKSHTFPSAAPPPGGREAGAAGDRGRPPAAPPPPAERCVPGLKRSRCRRRLPPSVRVCVPGSGSIQPALFLPAAPQRASEEGERGSLSAKCCSLVLRGGCSSSNSHSFRRLT